MERNGPSSCQKRRTLNAKSKCLDPAETPTWSCNRGLAPPLSSKGSSKGTIPIKVALYPAKRALMLQDPLTSKELAFHNSFLRYGITLENTDNESRVELSFVYQILCRSFREITDFFYFERHVTETKINPLP